MIGKFWYKEGNIENLKPKPKKKKRKHDNLQSTRDNIWWYTKNYESTPIKTIQNNYNFITKFFINKNKTEMAEKSNNL